MVMPPSPPAQAQITSQPTNKVLGAAGGSAVGTAIASLIVWGLDNYHLLSAQPLPDKVQTSITVIVTAVITFAGGYYVRPNPTQTTLKGSDGKNYTAM